MKGSKLIPSSLRAWILCFLIPALLCCIFFIADFYDSTRVITGYYHPPGIPLLETWDKYPIYSPLAWAPPLSVITGFLVGFYIFYFVAPYTVYHNAKKVGRNAVRWTTAFVIFTPVLAGIAYLLTWPRSKE
jgi:hypothetical protein